MADYTDRIILSQNDRDFLKTIIRKRNSKASEVTRARIILYAANGCPDRSIAWTLLTTTSTVRKWRLRWKEMGRDGLKDKPRPGASRKISSKKVIKLAPSGRTV